MGMGMGMGMGLDTISPYWGLTRLDSTRRDSARLNPSRKSARPAHITVLINLSICFTRQPDTGRIGNPFLFWPAE